ncbi:hypothetical protein D3C76_1605660 [compost metagenome]
MLWWIYCDGVTGVNPCTFNMLHDARNQYCLTVTNGINLNLFTKHVAVNQYRMLRIDVYCLFHIFQ